MTRVLLELFDIVPCGLMPNDTWHPLLSATSCSRCKAPLPEDAESLLIRSADGDSVLAFCDACTGRDALR